ncbi:MAG: sodium-dependent transporter [Eggerthellaceae bacterium]|nr:sodium-dependent transporter [Eggerthellaceae bacterium]
MAQREQFASRLGFLLISAGCAIGLGNVWRFPYITGQYGGGAFVIMYILFLVLFSLPILAMEFAVGRGAQRGPARAYDVLEPKGSKWHMVKWMALVGNYLLMMFYTTVAGWMLAYVQKSAVGTFNGATPDQVGAVFDTLLANPGEMILWMVVVCAIGLAACAAGLQGGVERVTKIMMLALLLVMALLVIRSMTLPGAAEGIKFYLMPDFGNLLGGGLSGFGQAAYAAMGQAFFTLSLGIGSMLIFGSYIGRDHSLMGESLRIGALDTGVALMAGLIIFPACFAVGVEPGAGPGLVFVTLPNVFGQMPLGQLWCTLFFVFLSFAALSTVIAVFENIIAFSMDQWNMPRGKATLINGVLLVLLSLPCALGFNVWSGCTLPHIGDIQASEDFIVSNNLLPIGALVILLFCTRKSGWGWDNFVAEADKGTGAKYPKWARAYMTYVVPVLIIVVLIMGWVPVVTG